MLKTDTDFQNKLKEAASSYNGEQTAEAVFNTVLAPVAAEYGITATSEADILKNEISASFFHPLYFPVFYE